MSKLRPGCQSAMPQGMRSRSDARCTPTSLLRTRRKARSVPGVQRPKRSTPNRQTNAQRVRRSTPTVRPVSSDGSDQLPTTGRVSNGRRACHSNRRTGPRTKDQRQLRRLCPRCLRRTNVNSASAAFPRGRPGESESSSGRTRATGIAHPGFYGRKPWRKPNSAVIVAVPGAAKEGLQDPPGELPPNRSLKLTAKPPNPTPGYRHSRPKVIRRRSSRLRRALRVS